MAARREAEDADAGGVDHPLPRAEADDPEGTLRVLQGGLVPLAALAGGDTVLEHNAGNADRVEPLRDLGPLLVVRQDVVAPAGTDHDGGAGVLLAWWEEDLESRLGHVAEADRVVARFPRLFLLRPDLPRLARRDPWPEANRLVGRAPAGAEKGQ